MEKRYNSRCMYGGYKPEIDFKAQNSRFKAFLEKVEQGTSETAKRFKSIVFIALAALFLVFLIGCKPQQTIIKEETVTRYIDSTILHTDTTYFEVPVEVYKDYTGLLDTLKLESKYAVAWSAVDTNRLILIGELRNKNIKVPVEYVWKDHIIYQDSIVESIKEIPTPYEVVKTKTPAWAWWTLFICLGFVVYFGFKLYIKFWKP